MAMMKNRIPLILLLNIAGVALFCSWYLPANHGAWLPVDSAIFHFFNHGVSVSHAYAWLLAIINNRAFDACSLLAMGCLMLSYWLKAPTAGRRQIAIMGLVMLLAAVIINQLAQHLMPVQRASPSLFFSDKRRKLRKRKPLQQRKEAVPSKHRPEHLTCKQQTASER